MSTAQQFPAPAGSSDPPDPSLGQPTSVMRIGVVMGSTRPGRRAAEVAAWVHRTAARRSDAAFEVVDLDEHDLPLLDEPVPAASGRYRHEHTRRWAARIAALDGFVFVTPEYNHAPPAALKNALDYLYAEWADKAAGFVGYGPSGAMRAVEQLRLVLGELQVADVRAQVALFFATDFPDGALAPSPRQQRALIEVLDHVVRWSAALAPLRR